MTGAAIPLMSFAAQGEKDRRGDALIQFPLGENSEFVALTQGVANGDEAAARSFFERYFDRLFRFAVVLARGDEHLARDIVSIAMVKAVRSMRAMRTDEDIWRWLSRIACNGFIDHCRRNQRRVTTVSDETAWHEQAAPNVDATLQQALNECMADLPADERRILESFYFEEHSQNELAVESNSTRKAVESRLARIRKKLRVAILKKLA